MRGREQQENQDEPGCCSNLFTLERLNDIGVFFIDKTQFVLQWHYQIMFFMIILVVFI